MKISNALMLVVALPAGLFAQQPQGAPPTDPITSAFRRSTMNLQRNLAQALDSIPDAKFAYKPTAAQMTVGDIAQHIASDNYFYCNNFGAMKGVVATEDTATADSVKATWPKQTLVTKLKASFKFCEDAFAQLNDGALAEQVTLTFGKQSRTLPRATMVLGHVTDMADHYSQIANYMRLNGMLPPTALPRR